MSELLFSHKPEILRLHEIEEQERTKFCTDFNMVLAELLPSLTLRKIRSSQIISRILAVCPDAYYTLVTTLKCRRRLGQQYTYIAMYKQKHYEEEGTLLNSKTRALLSVVQLLSRHLIVPSFTHIINKKGDENGNRSQWLFWWQKIQKYVTKYIGSAEDIIANVEWIVLMLFMLNWSKRYTIIQSLLGISYVYTYKSDGLKDVSYKIQGYLILITLLVKILKQIYSLYQEKKAQKENKKNQKHVVKEINRPGKKQALDNKKEKVLCRICYDDMKSRSATKCGHIFCWQCIIQTLEMTEECPVCRTNCFPRQVTQLRNY